MDTDLNKLAQTEVFHLLQQFCQSQELLWTKPRKKKKKHKNNKNWTNSPQNINKEGNKASLASSKV